MSVAYCIHLHINEITLIYFQLLSSYLTYSNWLTDIACSWKTYCMKKCPNNQRGKQSVNSSSAQLNDSTDCAHAGPLSFISCHLLCFCPLPPCLCPVTPITVSTNENTQKAFSQYLIDVTPLISFVSGRQSCNVNIWYSLPVVLHPAVTSHLQAWNNSETKKSNNNKDSKQITHYIWWQWSTEQ